MSHPESKRSRVVAVRVVGAAILASLVFVAAYYMLIAQKSSSSERASLTAVYPELWDVPLRRVHKVTENTIHYDLRNRLGEDESSSLLPRGSGMLHLGQDNGSFSISMFHQLRCIDIIGREQMARFAAETPAAQLGPPSALSHHCMNYLRQMVLCRADTTLESATTDYGPHIVTRAVTHTCNDWSALYAAAEENYALYVDSETVSV